LTSDVANINQFLI